MNFLINKKKNYIQILISRVKRSKSITYQLTNLLDLFITEFCTELGQQHYWKYYWGWGSV